MVETITGPVQPSALGWCQMHEHIFVLPTPNSQKNPALCMDHICQSAMELHHYHAAGGCSIVDAQPVGAGRSAKALLELSRSTGVFIVASTGYHLDGFYPEDSRLRRLSGAALCDLYRKELTEGMLLPDGVTRIPAKAGIVKTAIPKEGPVGRYRIQLTAAAQAAAECGAPLMLHTEAGAHGTDAAELCFDQGLVPEKLILCHADRQVCDLRVHDTLAALGVWLEYDTIGRFKYHSDEAEAELLCHMLQTGHKNQILLSLDTTAARLGTYGGSITLNYLMDAFLPLLQQRGVPKETLTQLLIRNPAQVFS